MFANCFNSANFSHIEKSSRGIHFLGDSIHTIGIAIFVFRERGKYMTGKVYNDSKKEVVRKRGSLSLSMPLK